MIYVLYIEVISYLSELFKRSSKFIFSNAVIKELPEEVPRDCNQKKKKKKRPSQLER